MDKIYENKKLIIVIMCLIVAYVIYKKTRGTKEHLTVSKDSMTKIATIAKTVTIDNNNIKIILDAYSNSVKQPIDNRLNTFKSSLKKFKPEFLEFVYWKLRMSDVDDTNKNNIITKSLKSLKVNESTNEAIDVVYEIIN